MDIRGLATCDDIINKIAFHGVLPRSDISKMTGLSGAAVSNYTKWILQSEVLTAETVRQAHAIRPVQLLRMNKNRGTSLVVIWNQHQMEAELVALDASPICRWVEKIQTPDQPGVLRALNRVVDHGMEKAAHMLCQISLLGICVRGAVDLGCASINTVAEFPSWRMCDLFYTMPSVRRLGACRTWPTTLCRAYALAAQQRAEQLAYLEVWKGGFGLASIEQCRPRLGKRGNSADLFHQPIGPGCPLCYCGTEGCMVSHIENGTMDPEILEQIAAHAYLVAPAKMLAIQWAVKPSLIDPLLRKAGFTNVIRPENPDELVWQGLRLITSETAATRILKARTKIVNDKTEAKWNERLRARLLQSGTLVIG